MEFRNPFGINTNTKSIPLKNSNIRNTAIYTNRIKNKIKREYQKQRDLLDNLGKLIFDTKNIDKNRNLSIEKNSKRKVNGIYQHPSHFLKQFEISKIYKGPLSKSQNNPILTNLESRF